MKRPEQLENVETKQLSEICQKYIDFVDNDKEYHEDNNFKQFIFEAAMESIFGEDVWDFINNRLESA